MTLHRAPIRRAPIRRAPTHWAVLAGAALALSACGSAASTRTTAPGPTAPGPTASVTTVPSPTATTPTGAGNTTSGPDALITDPARVGLVTVGIGGVVRLMLAPERAAHHPDGSAVTWPTPTGSDAAVLRPVGYTPCPAAVTCGAFEAVGAGRARILAVAPGGIICGTGSSHCVGVSAPLYVIPVTVQAAAGPASLTPRAAG